MTQSAQTYRHRQVVVFVRVNDMDAVTVERQQTFVIDVDGPEELEDVIPDALQQALAQARAFKLVEDER